jgi:hypothetical protein
MLSWNDVRFYGLLYVNDAREIHANLRASQQKALETYLRCAMLCDRSMRHHGYKFSLITNRASQLQEMTDRVGGSSITILERPFTLSVPTDAPFYSAHFKLDLMATFGSGGLGEAIALVDIDTVLLQPFQCAPPNDGLIGYDISDQVFPAYGSEVIRNDMELVAGGSLSAPRWWGGEFIAGPAVSFQKLSDTIGGLWPTYLEHRSQLHHAGDEMLTSTALEVLKSTGLQATDATNTNVCRWWSSRTRHRQIPLPVAMETCLLHLPADKAFLQSQAEREFNPASFLQTYFGYAKKKNFTRGMFALAAKAIGRDDGRLLPRLR